MIDQLRWSQHWYDSIYNLLKTVRLAYILYVFSVQPYGIKLLIVSDINVRIPSRWNLYNNEYIFNLTSFGRNIASAMTRVLLLTILNINATNVINFSFRSIANKSTVMAAAALPRPWNWMLLSASCYCE